MAIESESSKEETQIIDQSNTSELKDIINNNVELHNNLEDMNPDQEEREAEWFDVLGSGQLLKKIINNGEKDTKPQISDICTVKYVGKFEDKVVDEELVTINIGDAEVIQGLDLTLPRMDLGEEAEIKIGPRFAFGSEGRQPDIPPDATLHYTVTLVSFKPTPLVGFLPFQIRKEIGNRKKERGNYWYSRNDYTAAIHCYQRALEYLELSEECRPESYDEIRSLQDEVYDNLVKALYGKGRILAEKGEIENAIRFLRKALNIQPGNIEARAELDLLLVKQKYDDPEQREKFEKIVKDKYSLPDERRWGVWIGGVGALLVLTISAYKLFKPV